MDTEKFLREVRIITWSLVPIYLVFFMPGQIARTISKETTLTRTMISDQGQKTRDLISTQLAGTRADLISRTDAALRRVDATLLIVSNAEVDANNQIAGARKDIADIGKMADVRLAAVTDVANGLRSDLKPTLDNAASLEYRYTVLPEDIRADREYQGLIAETMGVLGATKVTMGQVAKTAKVIADEAPKMTEHVETITADVTKEADALTKPQSFWAALRTWLLTIARIYGAI